MIVEETLAADENSQGYPAANTTIVLKGESQNGSDEYVLRLSDTPWGCTGPGSWSLSYDALIGEQATILEETCGGMVTNVTIDGVSGRFVLSVSTQYLLEDKGEVDLILGSMSGLRVSQ